MWWLLACAGSDKPAPSDPDVPAELQPIVHTFDELPLILSASPGWELDGFTRVGDFDGDGVDDLRFVVTQAGEWRYGILRGPLTEPHTVPDDAWIVFPEDSYVDFEDLTGDGVFDVFLRHEDVLWWKPGPYDGTLVPDESWSLWPEVYGLRQDVSGDGVPDLIDMRYSTAEVHFTWGPPERFGGPPDVTVAPLCSDPLIVQGDILAAGLHLPGDLDSDGVQELQLLGDLVDCSFVMPLPAGGTVDPADSAVWGIEEIVWDEADWNGDGLGEVQMGSHLLLSPIELTAPSLTASERIPLSFSTLPFDLRGDGGLDALVSSGGGVALRSGLQALRDGADSEVWEGVQAQSLFLEGDHAWMLVTDDYATWRLADLGPAN
jgi:hypothetical protein